MKTEFRIGRKMKIKLLTFPRSGSHYLKELMEQKTGLRIDGNHIASTPADFVITIVRNPLDCFISSIKMDEYFRGIKDKDVRIKNELIIKQYVDFHNKIAERANVIIDYNDLINYPYKVVHKLSRILGLQELDVEYKTQLKDKPEIKYLVSSKKVQLKADHYVYSYDLTQPKLAYEKILEKKLIIT